MIHCYTLLTTVRHTSVLYHKFTLVQNLSKETDWIIHTDLLGHNNKCGISTVSTAICVTTQIPDIVMINRPHKIALFVEVIVCFETNFEKSGQRKENRYGSLQNDIQSTGFTYELITIEVGSRGLVSVDNRSKLTIILYKSQWKNIVKEKSRQYDKTRWELKCGLYEGMDIYIKVMPEVYKDIWPWWIYSSNNFHDIRRCSLLLRVVGDVLGFNNNENVCLLCQSRCVGPSGLI